MKILILMIEHLLLPGQPRLFLFYHKLSLQQPSCRGCNLELYGMSADEASASTLGTLMLAALYEGAIELVREMETISHQ